MNSFTRPATPADLDTIQEIFDAGKDYLKSQGLPQWQDGHGPTIADTEPEILAGQGHVLVVDGVVSGYTSLIPEPDGSPDLAEGAFDVGYGQYVAIHRVALSPAVRGRGLSGGFMRDVLQAAREAGYRDIRIDTHPGNEIMQKVIMQMGFVYKGIMELDIPNGTRYAYQLVLD